MPKIRKHCTPLLPFIYGPPSPTPCSSPRKPNRNKSQTLKRLLSISSLFLLLIFCPSILPLFLFGNSIPFSDRMAMSSGGPTTPSTNVSPRNPPGPTTTRRRVDAVDRTSNFSDYYDASDEEDNLNGSSIGPHHHHHNHYHNHNHNHHPVIRYLLLRRKLFFFVPETWFLTLEDGCHWTATMAQGLISGKNMGRKIFVALMLMAVISVFVKVSFWSEHLEKRRENGLLILQTFKNDWAWAQRVVTETEASVSRTEASMPKRVLEKFPVSEKTKIFLDIFLNSFYFPLSVWLPRKFFNNVLSNSFLLMFLCVVRIISLYFFLHSMHILIYSSYRLY